ncbi:MAG: hypothetical protein JNM29_16350 [Candidatus Odyssella sp.]|nr:hypothetical protein [Candidatus Odyssella sp.]
MLKPAEMIARLRRARRLVHEIHVGTDIPQIQSILRHADQNLHWALWNLGEIDELRPDLPGSVKPAARAKPKPGARKRAKKR